MARFCIGRSGSSFCGVVYGLAFTNGTAETNDPYAAALFKNKAGYVLIDREAEQEAERPPAVCAKLPAGHAAG